MDDRQLLRQFTQHNSQEAFAALTARHLNLVCSTCRRELDDADLAEDVTQAVFLILARKAPTLRREVVLSGWLFQTARLAAKNARTSETRRKATEQKAADMVREQQMQTEDAAWTDIEPLLNQSLAGLRDTERECVLLRFFQDISFAKAGAACAARAASFGLAPTIARLVSGILAGHSNAALTGPHVYQPTRGTLTAMRTLQIKTAAGLTLVLVAGLVPSAVAKRPAPTATKPGHVLRVVPGKTPTAPQIAERCRAAYSGLRFYRGTTTSDTHMVTTGEDNHEICSASIQFARPGKIHAEAKILLNSIQFAHPSKTHVNANIPDRQTAAFISDGVSTEESLTLSGASHNWKKALGMNISSKGIISRSISGTVISSTEAAINDMAVDFQQAAAPIPLLLLGETSSIMVPIPLNANSAGKDVDAEVREGTVNSRLCYILTVHDTSPYVTHWFGVRVINSVWIDEKTYLLCRLVEDTDIEARTESHNGKLEFVPATKAHTEQNFINERLNEPISDSVFALPPVQQ